MFGFFKKNSDQNKQHTEAGVKRSRDRWFGRVLELLRSSKLDDSVWDQLEEILISADVGVDSSLRIIEELKTLVKNESIDDPEVAFDKLKLMLSEDLAGTDNQAFWDDSNEAPKPYVILMVGVNGVGKTTSIAKLAHHLTSEGKKVILGAADTFRAAAEEQLEILGSKVGVDVISHQPGSDPGAVTFDACEAARARDADVLIIDTAGRLHTRLNLMEELKKVNRVIQRFDPTAPHQVLLTLDATTGLNGLSQASAFKDAVGLTGIFLAKLDGTARGGIALAIKHELDVPIVFMGTGESLQDIAPFDATDFINALLEPSD